MGGSRGRVRVGWGGEGRRYGWGNGRVWVRVR